MRMARRTWRARLAIGLLIGAAATATAAGADERDETRALMRRIYASMETLLPLSADPQRFADPFRKGEIRGALDALAGNADALAKHAGAHDAEARYLGGALAHDARETRRFYDLGNFDSAAFFLRETTSHCVACHSRLPSPGDSPISAGFVTDAALRGLPPLERARLLVATRRFDDALAAYERVFADPDASPMEMHGALMDYLVVALRAERDFARPVPVLRRFGNRPDLWEQFREEVRAWIAEIQELAPTAEAPPSLARARELLAAAATRTRFPTDHRGLVHYIAASGVLHRLLADDSAPAGNLAEIYYRLGVAELHLERGYWLSQADFFLESAIRTAPKGPFAREAYAVLEQETLFAYTGSAGQHVPDDVKKRLAELRRLAGE
jgi:hypothetical protein